MLLVDDRFMRAHQAFLNNCEMWDQCVQSRLSQKGIPCSDRTRYVEEYNRLIAEKIEDFISAYAGNRAERIAFECSIAAKVTNLEHKFK